VLEETDRQSTTCGHASPATVLASGAHTGFHRHDTITLSLPVTLGACGSWRRKEVFSDLSSGVAYFRRPVVEHDVFNGGDQDLVFVEIELIS